MPGPVVTTGQAPPYPLTFQSPYGVDPPPQRGGEASGPGRTGSKLLTPAACTLNHNPQALPCVNIPGNRATLLLRETRVMAYGEGLGQERKYV